MADLVAPIFGTGQEGDRVVSTSETLGQHAAAFIGTAGSTTGSGTNPALSSYINFPVIIHQTQGTNAGQWERNFMIGYSSGSITLALPLTNTYTTGAQIAVMSQRRSLTITSSGIWNVWGWAGDIRGTMFACVSGTLTVAGTINGTGKGFRGATATASDGGTTGQGEGTGGPGDTASTATNGNGAGGALVAAGNKPGGGGGGNAAAGTSGGNGSGTGGAGGLASGSADLGTITMGGGGSAGGTDGSGGDRYLGNAGGAVIIIYARNIVVTGSITVNGETATGSGGSNVGGGGGGAGGSILLIGENISLGSGLVTALGSSGRTAAGSAGSGGAGANGRIALARCSATGTTNPTYTDRGYQLFCGVVGRGS